MKQVALFLGFFFLTSAAFAEHRIAVIGDSLMEWNTDTGQSIADYLSDLTNHDVEQAAISGAEMTDFWGDDIRNQIDPADFDIVVMNGGMNDLSNDCGCGECDSSLDRLISDEGDFGKIPDFVEALAEDMQQVVYVGYPRPVSKTTELEPCRAWANRLETRLAQMARRFSSVRFVKISNAFPVGDTSFFDDDEIHPSPKGSAAVARRVASVLALD